MKRFGLGFDGLAGGKKNGEGEIQNMNYLTGEKTLHP